MFENIFLNFRKRPKGTPGYIDSRLNTLAKDSRQDSVAYNDKSSGNNLKSKSIAAALERVSSSREIVISEKLFTNLLISNDFLTN